MKSSTSHNEAVTYRVSTSPHVCDHSCLNLNTLKANAVVDKKDDAKMDMLHLKVASRPETNSKRITRVRSAIIHPSSTGTGPL